MSNTLRRRARTPVAGGRPLNIRKAVPATRNSNRPDRSARSGRFELSTGAASPARWPASEVEDHEVVLTLVDDVVLVLVEEDRQVDVGGPADRLVVGATADDRRDGD